MVKDDINMPYVDKGGQSQVYPTALQSYQANSRGKKINTP